MKQYHEHLELILQKGTKKAPAREGMPESISYFGHQNRYDLSKGFPILTTKKVSFKNIVVELLWFLRGDTNVKYLNDNGCEIWNQDAYNYYCKIAITNDGKAQNAIMKDNSDGSFRILTFDEFVFLIQCSTMERLKEFFSYENYTLGDCGKQYGWLWRNWEYQGFSNAFFQEPDSVSAIDQLKNLIQGLKVNPEGRRHIITAWNPATLEDMALNACHAFVQFNCREIEIYERGDIFVKNNEKPSNISKIDFYNDNVKTMDSQGIPKYYLDCQMYQRSADMFLGVPYNISSYVLLTHIIAKICNMIPGDFIHTFGDSHIYDNHMDQVKEILSRDPEKYKLPILKIADNTSNDLKHFSLDEVLKFTSWRDFTLEGYESYPAIKAKLSTGLK